MSHKPNPKQALFLWKLITAETAEEREPMISKARPELTPKERKPLVDHGFVALDKRPKKRGSYYVLTDRAWAWAADTLDVEIMRSSSMVGAEALQGLLRRLLPFLKQQGLPLASLFSAPPGGAEREVGATQTSSNGDAEGLATRIEAACLTLAGGARQKRVRLSALRRQLGSVERAALDQTLLALQDAGRLVLYRDDNTSALTDDDHRAALVVGNAPRHLVYLEA